MSTVKKVMLQKYNELKDNPPLTFDEINNENMIVPLDVVNEIEDVATYQATIDEDDTAAVVRMMMEMGQVVHV